MVSIIYLSDFLISPIYTQIICKIMMAVAFRVKIGSTVTWINHRTLKWSCLTCLYKTILTLDNSESFSSKLGLTLLFRSLTSRMFLHFRFSRQCNSRCRYLDVRKNQWKIQRRQQTIQTRRSHKGISFVLTFPLKMVGKPPVLVATYLSLVMVVSGLYGNFF